MKVNCLEADSVVLVKEIHSLLCLSVKFRGRGYSRYRTSVVSDRGSFNGRFDFASRSFCCWGNYVSIGWYDLLIAEGAACVTLAP